MKNKAEELIQRFQESRSATEKEAIAAEYRALYLTLSEKEKVAAKSALRPLFDALKPQLEQADEILERLEKWKQPSV